MSKEGAFRGGECPIPLYTTVIPVTVIAFFYSHHQLICRRRRRQIIAEAPTRQPGSRARQGLLWRAPVIGLMTNAPVRDEPGQDRNDQPSDILTYSSLWNDRKKHEEKSTLYSVSKSEKSDNETTSTLQHTVILLYQWRLLRPFIHSPSNRLPEHFSPENPSDILPVRSSWASQRVGCLFSVLFEFSADNRKSATKYTRSRPFAVLINDSWLVEFVSGAATTGNNQYRYVRYAIARDVIRRRESTEKTRRESGRKINIWIHTADRWSHSIGYT